MMLLRFSCLLLFGSLVIADKLVKKRVYVQNGGYIIYEGGSDNGRNWAAELTYDHGFEKTGWNTISVVTNPKVDDAITANAAGWIEGYSEHKIIYNSWRNMQEGFCDDHGEEFCTNLNVYLKKNIDWMSEQIKENAAKSPYWYQVNLILAQLVGLHAGYTKAVSEDPKNFKQISMEDILLMNLSGDIDDLTSALSPSERKKTLADNVEEGTRFANSRCSALIKVLQNNSDLLVSQVTWNSYQSMLRNIKKYDFEFQKMSGVNETVPGKTAVFSSYPTYLGSGDDYYLLSSGLLTMETTIGNSNPDLWKYVDPVGQVQEWIRVIVANRLATTGKEWADIFSRYNSGTYNNQWMIVDYNKFKPGEPISSDVLWIIEQLPGTIVYGDQSHILRDQSYWPSYNTPFYPEIFNKSGLPALVEKYGDWFSYDRTPRALIFKRDHSKVVDFDSFFRLMRYNDFQNDPLSRCECDPPYSGENGISARSDLNLKNGTYPFAALGHRDHGGTDVKATTSSLFKQMVFGTINSPTFDQQPVFKWSEQDFADTTPHFMHPDEFKFPFIYTKFD